MVSTLRQCFKRIIIQELINGCEFTTAGLQHFLSYHTTKTSTHRTESSTTCFGESTDYLFIQITKLWIMIKHNSFMFIIIHHSPVIAILYLPPSPLSPPLPYSPIHLHPHHSRDKGHGLHALQTNPEREQQHAERRHGQIYQSQ